jgi:hypothetical protein
VVGDLFDLVDASHQFLKDLLQVEAGYNAVKRQATLRVAPTHAIENESIRALLDPAADCFVNLVVADSMSRAVFIVVNMMFAGAT